MMHPMKRKALIVLLSLGTVGGFASGFMSLSCHQHRQRHRFREMVTDICTDAVRAAQRPAVSPDRDADPAWQGPSPSNNAR